MGIGAVVSCSTGKKHLQNVENGSRANFLKRKGIPLTKETSLDEEVELKNTLQSFIGSSNTLHSEILWALKVAHSHYSFSSSDETGDLFRVMFPDSQVAARFKCGETRCRYLTTFGLAPRFSEMLQTTIRVCSDYVLLFDESLNKKNHMKQMDFMIRIWEESSVKTRYLTSEFLGHATAKDMASKFESVFAEFHLRKEGLLQLGMDGPNVNWSVYNIINCNLKDNHGVSLLHTGSCSLHTVHNAFRAGCEATGWDIELFLVSAYKLFEDSPARLEDYFSVTGATSLPLKFCRHRWLENALPAMRAIELLPALELFVKAALQKKITLPQSATFQAVKSGVTNPLMACQLSFFASVAKLIEPFLTKYQSDRPLIPFLYSDLHDLLKNLMQRFINEDALKDGDLLKVDIADVSNHLHNVQLGFQTSNLFRKVKAKSTVSERQTKDFEKQCKAFLLPIVKKLTEKCPLKYSVIRYMPCLDPAKMTDKKVCKENMQKLLHSVIDSKRLMEDTADSVLQEYTHFLSTAALANSANSFDREKDRVDTWWFEALGQNADFRNLNSFVKKMLLLSHGQATVERGFSFNKEVSADNLSQQTLRARRIVIDHIHNAGGVMKVNLDKPLLVSAGAAWGKYER